MDPINLFDEVWPFLVIIIRICNHEVVCCTIYTYLFWPVLSWCGWYTSHEVRCDEGAYDNGALT